MTTPPVLVSLVSLLLIALSGPALANPCGTGPSACGDAHMVLAQLNVQAPGQGKAKPSPQQDATTAEPVSHRPSDKKMAKVYDNNQQRLEKLKLKLDRRKKSDLEAFYKSWEKNKAKYEAVAKKTGVPAELIAALHWRESTGNFNTYLHQGDPLGKKAVNWPNNIPIFHKWESAAEHALNQKKWLRDKLKIDADTTDLAALATYAEYYNGLGYHYKGKPSPYVWSGTNQYTRGKYVADGKYSSVTKDKQLGVVAMIQYIRDQQAAATVPLPTRNPTRPQKSSAVPLPSRNPRRR